MELFTTLFSDLLVFVYHCFDRIVIHGYLSGLSRPEQVVHFFRQVVGAPVVSKELLSQRTSDYQNWVEAFARNHKVFRSSGPRKAYVRRTMFSPGYGEWFAAPLPAAPSAHHLSTRFRALALFGRRSSERKMAAIMPGGGKGRR